MAQKLFSVFRGAGNDGGAEAEAVVLPAGDTVQDFRAALLAKLRGVEGCAVVPLETDVLQCYHEAAGWVILRDMTAATARLRFFPKDGEYPSTSIRLAVIPLFQLFLLAALTKCQIFGIPKKA